MSLLRGVSFSLVALIVSCRPLAPHTLLTIDDPQGIAGASTTLAVGLNPDDLSETPLVSPYPSVVTVTANQVGEALVWVEARDGDGVTLGRAKANVQLRRSRPVNIVVNLGQPCEETVDCDDGIYCNGPEACRDRVCAQGDAPCQPSPHLCVDVTCVEMAAACGIAVQHAECPAIEVAGTLRAQICDAASGCVLGDPCITPSDCDNGFVCDGLEQCIAGRCIAGVPPPRDDGDACTLDACIEPTGVANFPDPSLDGVNCAGPTGADHICNAGACQLSTCGDGLVDARTEECDDGNANPNDGCHASTAGCRITSWTPSLITGLGLTRGAPQDQPSPLSAIATDAVGNLFFVHEHYVTSRLQNGDNTVSHWAGSSEGFSGDGGPAVLASIDADDIAVDGTGRLYLAGGNRVRMVDAASGIIDTFAGNGVTVFGGDGGAATAASFASISDIEARANGDLLVVTTGRVRLVSRTTGIVNTVAGNGMLACDGSGDGEEASSVALCPSTVAPDSSGGFYLADGPRLRHVSATGILTTVPVDIGTSAYDDLLVVSTGEIYAAAEDRLVKIDPLGSTWMDVSLPANATRKLAVGTVPLVYVSSQAVSIEGPTGDGSVFAYNWETDDVTIVISGSQPVGNGRLPPSCTRAGSNGVAFFDAAVGPSGDLFAVVTQEPLNFFQIPAVLHVSAATNLVSTASIAATTIAATPEGRVFVSTFDGISEMLADTTLVSVNPRTAVNLNPTADNNLLAADLQQVVLIDVLSGMDTVLAGNGTDGCPIDGEPATEQPLPDPVSAVYAPSGDLFILSLNDSIFRVDSAGDIHTITCSTSSVFWTGPKGGAVAAPDGTIYLRLNLAGELVRLDPLTELTEVVAGPGTGWPPRIGADPLSSSLPAGGLAVGIDGELIIAGGDVLVAIDPTSGRLEPVMSSNGSCYWPNDGPLDQANLDGALALDSVSGDQVLVTDSRFGRVRLLDLSSNRVDTAAGYPHPTIDDYGPLALYSRALLEPAGIAGSITEFFVAERKGHTIRRFSTTGNGFDRESWTVSELTGKLPLAQCCALTSPASDCSPAELSDPRCAPDSPGFADGTLANARFSGPTGLAYAPNDPLFGRVLYVAEADGHTVRQIRLDTGDVVLLGGTPGMRGFAGEGAEALLAIFSEPSALALGPGPAGQQRSLYVADTGNHRVRRLDLDTGLVTTVVGNGAAASGGDGAPARFFAVEAPRGLYSDTYGNLWVSSTTTVRVVFAGVDGIATGEDEVRTVYGLPPREDFPEVATMCLAGLGPDPRTNDDGRMIALDRCRGYAIELQRSANP